MNRRAMTTAAVLLLGALSPGVGTSRADDHEARERGDRLDHDVRVRLKVRGKRSDRLRIEIKVKNRGRLDEDQLLVVLHDGDTTEPIWSQRVTLDSGDRQKFRLRLDRADVGGVLTAFVESADEDAASRDDNEDSDDVAPGTPTEASAAERGRDLYLPLCSGCHGADGRGATVEESIARESWDEFVEAFREGEDGMPTFPELSSRDARDIVAYLRDPAAVDRPTPTPTPSPAPDVPPTGTTPTYTADVKALLDARCGSCHRSGAPAAGVALDTYNKAVRNAGASLSSIRAGRMPPGGALPQSEIETIAAWVDGGSPN